MVDLVPPQHLLDLMGKSRRRFYASLVGVKGSPKDRHRKAQKNCASRRRSVSSTLFPLRTDHFRLRVVSDEFPETGLDSGTRCSARAGCRGLMYACGIDGISPKRRAAISSMSYPSCRTRSST